MSHSDLLIRKHCEELLEYAYIAVRNFPKFERHVFGAEIRTTHAAGEIELPQVRAVVSSWIAHASHADTHGLREKILSEFRFSRSAAHA